MISSSILHFPNGVITSTTLFHYIRSFGSRMECADVLNVLLITKCSTIQNLIDKQLDVCNNYWYILTITQITLLIQYLIIGTFKIQECGKYIRVCTREGA